jgi:hypothetical protein
VVNSAKNFEHLALANVLENSLHFAKNGEKRFQEFLSGEPQMDLSKNIFVKTTFLSKNNILPSVQQT